MQDPDVVLGQGALGTLFATVLAQRQRPVEVVSRRVDEPKSVHLQLTGPGYRFEEQVRLTPRPPDRVRLAIVATRAGEALERARSVEDRLAEDGLIVPIQNGLVSLEVAEALETERVAPTVVGFNAQMTDERTVEVTSPGDLTIGAIDPAAEATARALAASFDRPIRAQTTSNPQGAVWSKWCVSCAINGLAATTGESVGLMTLERAGREALVGVLTECVRIAEAEDVELERVAGPFAPDTLAGPASSGLGGAFRRGVVYLVGRRYRDVVPSSVAAIEAGRDPELGTLNAEAVERGQTHGITTSWNEATLALAEEVHAGKREPTMANLAKVRERVET